MKYTLIFALLMSLAAGLARSECHLDPEFIGAIYTIEVDRAGENNPSDHSLILWRNPHRVILEYPASGFAESWARAPDGSLYLVRYFDGHARGIEYQPTDVRVGSKDVSWQAKWQLLSDDYREGMHLKGKQGSGCERAELLESGGAQRDTLHWLVALQLPRYWQREREEHTVRWQLQEIVSSKAKVAAAFALREDYQLTDYADIGDNESDHFFTEMMHLGFIDSGASGFYDQNGRALSGHRH